MAGGDLKTVPGLGQGVHKVNEAIFQVGRTLIITEMDDSKLDWDQIPDGTLRVDPKDGTIYEKLAGATTWKIGLNIHPRLFAGETVPKEPEYGDLWINVAAAATNNGIPVLAWFTGTDWQDITADALKVTNNLSDLSDVNKALQNLGLWGDNVETHYHDSHYKPMLQAETDARIAGDNNLQSQINNINTTLSAVKVNLDEIYRGFNPPASPVEGETIWFDYTDKVVKAFYGGVWNEFGGIYLPS